MNPVCRYCGQCGPHACEGHITQLREEIERLRHEYDVSRREYNIMVTVANAFEDQRNAARTERDALREEVTRLRHLEAADLAMEDIEEETGPKGHMTWNCDGASSGCAICKRYGETYAAREACLAESRLAKKKEDGKCL